MANMKESNEAIECPECGVEAGVKAGIKTPDGKYDIYQCQNCGAEFTLRAWLICPSCGVQGELTNDMTDDGFEVCICKNPDCSVKWFPGREIEEVQVSYKPTREVRVEEPVNWRDRLGELKEMMQACLEAATELVPGDVDYEEDFAATKYAALCHIRCECAVALFRALTAETARVVGALDKAAAMLDDMEKSRSEPDPLALMMGALMGGRPPGWKGDG